MNESTKTSLLGLSPLMGLFIPPFNLFTPLILWIIWRNDSPRISRIGKNIMSSQISWFLWILIGEGTLYVAALESYQWLLYLPWAFFSIIQAIKISSREDSYVMPLTIHFLH